MIKLIPFLLFAALVSADLDSSLSEPSNEQRFLFNTKTVTNLVLTTTTTSVAASTFCFSIVAQLIRITNVGSFTTSIDAVSTTIGSISNCRKRRWAFENPVDGAISSIEGGENIQAFMMQEGTIQEDKGADAEVKPADREVEADPIPSASQPVEEEEAEVEAKPEDARFLSLISTVTQTLTAVSSVTTQVATKTILVTCTPLNIGFPQC
ncbi:hypothetical protein QYM36_001092 [Artemia franciscana]|nr:hypothetical protein QYM36_001092 [Artemia franciscana]KAK2724469.1 hypothetical protein QYM36_001092 [Artemia franciscana]KAK2724471.1 hypothetical protein QYM36_001092 [Artemia franciscana]KAK2724472.1 hypothetical protein QYM36_001092 [Artemia franciscana]KAK2724473.1 hypothetical protein QYM36_001092 [Artemia franciscana]